MSKKPKPGGRVQISGVPYDVLEGPARVGGMYLLTVRRQSDNSGFYATAPLHQSGKGPWKISGPMIAAE
jgi:hypothetical protein